jgi:hypothetical protein
MAKLFSTSSVTYRSSRPTPMPRFEYQQIDSRSFVIPGNGRKPCNKGQHAAKGKAARQKKK